MGTCPSRFVALLLIICFALLLLPAMVTADEPESPLGYSSDHVLVRLTRAEAVKTRTRLAARRSIEVDRLNTELLDAIKPWNAVAIRAVTAHPFRDPAKAAELGLDRYFAIEIPPGTDAKSMVADLAKHGRLIDAVGRDAIGTVAQLFPTDPDFSRQHALHNTGVPDTGPTTDTCPDNAIWCEDADIDAPEAWDISTGHPDVIVAVVDSGVYPHMEFGNRILPGRNTVNNTSDTSDGCPHGTHVAGIILSGGNNGSIPCVFPNDPLRECGMAGINWQAKLLPVKVLSGCTGNASDVAEGIIWAADQGADVINVSLQFYNVSGLNLLLFQNAVDYAHGLGAVIVAASGNGLVGGAGVVAYPARLPNVVAVSGTTACDELATIANTGWNANYGPEIDLCAPGDDIYSTWTFDTYRCLFGTSMATAHVSGVASLIRSVAPSMPNDAVVALIKGTADDNGPEGPDEFCGAGRVNAYGAVTAAALSCMTSADCNDGTFCNGVETCVNESCVPGTTPDCNDGVDCTNDSCDSSLDQCVNATDDSLCDDGVFCNGTETCQNGLGCVAGTVPDCDDGVDCTNDFCDPTQNACANEPDDALCDDGDSCNGDEVCDAALGCQSGTAPNCDDGDSCTIDSCDQGCHNDRVCGACCQAGGTCVDLMTESECDATGIALFLGVGSACSGDLDQDGFDDTCPRLIPAVTEWGLVVLSLVLLVGMKLRFRGQGSLSGRESLV